MGFLGFGNKKDSQAEKFTQALATQYAREIANMTAMLGNGLPTLDADGYDYNNAFRTIGAVYETTDLISKKVINSPFVFYKIKDKKKLQQSKALQKTEPIQALVLKTQALEEVDNDALTSLLNKPNPYQTGNQFIWSVALMYLHRGNAYVHGNKVAGKVKQMWPIPNMEIIVNDLDLLDPILGYRMMFGTTALKQFTTDEIYHLKTGNPANIDNTSQYLYGISPLRAYIEQMRTIKEAQTQSSKQAKNGGVFGFLAPKDKEDQLSQDQKKMLHDKMKEARNSMDELARVFPSSIALQWQAMGLPIADLQLLELLGVNEESIYRAYHVPLSFHNQKASTDNNVGTEVKKMVYDAVLPVCEAISEFLTNFLAKAYGVDLIELDYTQLPEMAINMKEIAEYIKALPEGVLTLNEMRVLLKWGESKEAYMNEHYMNKGKVTVRSIFEQSKNPQTN